MTVFTCTKCGLPYSSDYPRPGPCPRCWVAANPGQVGKIAAGLSWQIDNLRSALAKAQWRLAEVGPPLRQEPSPIPPDLLKKVLGLVHPDRHGGSATATRTFQDLQNLCNSGGRHGAS